jgi:adenosine deaminase
MADHPLDRLKNAGCTLTLNSDDPPHFHTSIGDEYRIASETFTYDDKTQLEFTINAINAAFVDGDTRKRLLEKCVLTKIE